MRATSFTLVTILAALLGACGEKAPSSSARGDTPGGTESAGAASTEVGGSDSHVDVEPSQAHENYGDRTPEAILSEVRAAAAKAPEPLRPDDAWTAGVTTAIARSGIQAAARAAAFEVAGGRVEIVEALGPGRADAWVRIERWRGDGDRVLADRAGLYVTPMEHADVRVQPVDLGRLRAFRSTLDDPEHPTFAWLHRGLFVRIGATDQARATALHESLDEVGAYGTPEATPQSAPQPAPTSASAPGAGSPQKPTMPVEDPVVGRWVVRDAFLLTVRADGTWDMQRRGEDASVSSGTWRTDLLGTYTFATGKRDPEPATASIRRDGTLLLTDGGERIEARRDQPRKTSTFGLPKKGGDGKTGDMPFEESFGETEGLSDAPFEGPTKKPAEPERDLADAYTGGAFEGRRAGHEGAAGPRKSMADAVEDALRWLAAHQSPDGGWKATGFGRWCDGRVVPGGSSDGPGKAAYDPGVTGLALCAFLGAGYTNRGRHPYAKVVSRGLRYLKNIQDAEGCFGPRAPKTYVYNHAAGALALVEAYGMTGSPIYRGAAQRALDFIALARNPYFAWRYGIKPGDNDTSVSGWMMMPLKSAQLINRAAVARGKKAPLTIDEAAFDGLSAWLDKVTDPDYGSVGYVQRGTGPSRPAELVRRFPGEKSEAMTAVSVLARIFMGADPRKNRLVRLGADRCAKLPPRWKRADGSIDMVYWYYGTQAMYQVGGRHWEVWQGAMRAAIVDTQRRDTDPCRTKGSWDPVGPWGPDGGRVYSTAMMALCLEIFYRYDRLSGGR